MRATPKEEMGGGELRKKLTGTINMDPVGIRGG